MKLKLVFLTLSLLFIAFLFSSYKKGVTYTNGSPAGYTGSPFDNKTCTQCHVHVGSPLFKTNLIDSDIPASGFIAGETYSFTLTVSSPQTNKFGFICSPHDSTGQNLGTLAVTQSNKTKIVGSSTKYLTHTSGGVNGTNNMQTWSFDWTAPQGMQQVTFYAAFTAGSANNDSTFITDHTVFANTSSLTEHASEDAFRIFPNPTNDFIRFGANGQAPNDSYHYKIFDSRGRLIIESSCYAHMIDVSFLDEGIYILHLYNDNWNVSQKFLKKN